MASLPGFRFDVTGASGATGLLGPKNAWRAYVFPRGGYAAQDSVGTKITFDSASVASRFAVGNWIQAGLLTTNIRQVGAVGGTSLTVSGSALTVTTNDRIFLIGNTEPTINGSSATYTTPATIVRQRDDDAATLYTNSMITTNVDGLVQGFAATALYDLLIQDGNRANQGALIDLPVGVPEGISTSDSAVIGGSLTVSGNLSVGNSITARNIGCIRYAEQFATGSSTGGIQEAINDLPSGGGVVSLCSNTTYQPLLAISLVTGTRILGNGATIQRVAGLDALSVFKDAGSAISKVSVHDVVFDNNSRAATKEDILFTGGCTDIAVEDCRWINLTGRTEDLTRIATSATKGARIAFRNNTVIGPGAQQTYNSFQIFDCDNVDTSGNVIDGWGAIKLEGSLATNLYNWNVTNNRLKNVAQTNIFCRIQSGSSVTGIVVSNNTITDAGKAGIVIGAINPADTGGINTVSVTGNAIRGFALSLPDSGIALGGNVTSGTYYMTNVTVTGNAINGIDSTSVQPADQNRGIQFSSGIAHFSCTGNTVRNCGRDGIATLGARDGTIGANQVERCVVQGTTLGSAPTPDQEGGITIYTQGTYATKRIAIIGNVSKNNGVSGQTISYGINLGPNTGALKATFLTVANNICYDDQATPTQNYGMIIGSLGNQGPDDSNIYFNDLRGNSSGGILRQGTVVRTIFAGNLENASGTPANLVQAASLTLPDGDNFFGISGTLGAGTSISTMTMTPCRDVTLWAAVGTVGFSASNTLKVIGASFNVPVNAAVRAYCTGTTWFIFSPGS